MRVRRSLVVLLLTVVLINSCGKAMPQATPTPTRTPLPPATATSRPTATLLPPTPSPTPTAPPIIATSFPPDVNPLTGQKVDDQSLLDRIPVAIKVSNSPEVRPQSGLSFADLVFEHYAEGGITRFTAVFYDLDPKQVGSVRSGRLIDLEIPKMYQALFAYSGSSAGVKERIRNSPLFPDYIAAPDFGIGEPYFYRIPQEGKAFEHTLFTDPQILRKLADQRGINKRPDYPRFMAFSEAPPSGGQAVEYFEINYLQGVCTAEWTYNETNGNWLRATAGVAQNDALTGNPLAFENVVLVYANHVQTDILEDTWGGGHMSIQIQIWGTGPALIFRNGKMYQAFWHRDDPACMLTFDDGSGGIVPLKPGHTWFQLIPLETTSEEFQDAKWRFTP